MNLLETVRSAYAAGVELWLDEGRLRYGCHGPMPAELKAELRAHKPAITALLVAYGVGEQDDCGMVEGERSARKRYPTPPGCIAASACARLGWCERALDGLCCDRTKEAMQPDDEHDEKEVA